MLAQLKTRYCGIVFLLSLGIGYLLIPKRIWNESLIGVGVTYVFVFALTVTCVVKGIKEKMVALKNARLSALGMLASLIGISALQMCGVSLPMCGISMGGGIVALLLPGVLMQFIHRYAFGIVIGSILFQMYVLHSMQCFRMKISKGGGTYGVSSHSEKRK